MTVFHVPHTSHQIPRQRCAPVCSSLSDQLENAHALPTDKCIRIGLFEVVIGTPGVRGTRQCTIAQNKWSSGDKVDEVKWNRVVGTWGHDQSEPSMRQKMRLGYGKRTIWKINIRHIYLWSPYSKTRSNHLFSNHKNKVRRLHVSPNSLQMSARASVGVRMVVG